MDPNITNGIFTLMGVIIGGIISYFVSKDQKERDDLNRQIKDLEKKNASLKNNIIKLGYQVSSYWNIEKAYSQEVAQLTNRTPKKVLEERRNNLESAGYTRPTMTENSVRDILEKL